MKAERKFQPCPIFRYTTSIASITLASFVSSQSIAPAFAQVVSANPIVLPGANPAPSPTMSQAQQLQEAVSALGNAKTVAMVSEGAWGAVAALCGYNCFNFVTELMMERQGIYTEATALNTTVKSAATACSTGAPPPAPSLVGNQAGVQAAFTKISTDYNQSNTETGQASASKAAQSGDPAGGASNVNPSTAGGAQYGPPAPDAANFNPSTAGGAQYGPPAPAAAAQPIPEPPVPPASAPASGGFNTLGSGGGDTQIPLGAGSAPVTQPEIPQGLGPYLFNRETPLWMPKSVLPVALNSLGDFFIHSSSAASAPAASSAGPSANEAFSNEIGLFLTNVNTTYTAAWTQATAAQSAATAAVPSSSAQIAIATNCESALKPIPGASQELAERLTKYNQAITSVISVGNYCTIGAAAVAVGDLGYSLYQKSQADQSNPYESQLTSQTTSRIVGVAGVAATQVYGVYSEMTQNGINSPASQTAKAMGISSCATAGFSLYEGVSRNNDRIAITNSDSEDQQQLNNLNSNPTASPAPMSTSWNSIQQFRWFLTSLEIAEKIGKWIPDPLGTCAYASTDSVNGLSVCQSARDSQSSFLSCAKAGDPLLAQAFNQMGGEDRFFSVLEQTMGVNRSLFLSVDHAPTSEQIVSMMTIRAPQYRAGLNAVISDLRTQLAAHRGTSRPRLLGQQPQTQQPQAEQQSAGNFGGLFVSSVPAAQPPVQPLDLRAPASAPSLVDSESGDLFSRVSMRYQADRDRVAQLNWSTPYNRFSTRP